MWLPTCCGACGCEDPARIRVATWRAQGNCWSWHLAYMHTTCGTRCHDSNQQAPFVRSLATRTFSWGWSCRSNDRDDVESHSRELDRSRSSDEQLRTPDSHPSSPSTGLRLVCYHHCCLEVPVASKQLRRVRTRSPATRTRPSGSDAPHGANRASAASASIALPPSIRVSHLPLPLGRARKACALHATPALPRCVAVAGGGWPCDARARAAGVPGGASMQPLAVPRGPSGDSRGGVRPGRAEAARARVKPCGGAGPARRGGMGRGA
eukprot:362009-Chlamydomonas_euryale.AAC.4